MKPHRKMVKKIVMMGIYRALLVIYCIHISPEFGFELELLLSSSNMWLQQFGKATRYSKLDQGRDYTTSIWYFMGSLNGGKHFMVQLTYVIT